MANKEYAVIIQVGEQYTEQNWRPVTKVLKCTSETTLGEIEDWYNAFYHRGTLNVQISSLEQKDTL